MKRDPLRTMLRIRQSALDEAQAALAAAYVAEQEAAARVRAATEALDLEMRAATSLSAGDDAVENFARWLPTGRRRISEAHLMLQDATATLDRLRAVLALARAGVRTVETLIEQRRLEQEALRARTEQHTMDEVVATRRRR